MVKSGAFVRFFFVSSRYPSPPPRRESEDSNVKILNLHMEMEYCLRYVPRCDHLLLRLYHSEQCAHGAVGHLTVRSSTESRTFCTFVAEPVQLRGRPGLRNYDRLINIKPTNTAMANNKRLYRSREAWIGGVCGGIADYFGWDPTIVRLIYLVLTFTTAFAGIPIYVLLWIFVPLERYRNR